MNETFAVSCKIALYNPEHTKVLVAFYGPQINYGLIGGHMMHGESPDEALLREIYEEIGIHYTGGLRKVGFEIVNHHSDKKLCLEYTGILEEYTALTIDHSELVDAPWVPLNDIVVNTVSLGDYKTFVIANA